MYSHLKIIERKFHNYEQQQQYDCQGENPLKLHKAFKDMIIYFPFRIKEFYTGT